MNLYKYILVILILAAATTGLYAATDAQTGLTPALLDELRAATQMSSAGTALMNALTNNEINKLALNREFLKKHNNYFSNKIETKGIADQENSGRCWLFAGLNVLRPAIIKKYNLDEFEFSQSYLSFWDKLEKANFFLEYVIQTADRDLRDRELDFMLNEAVGDGGYWAWFAELVEKYGVVPKDAFPETQSSSNTSLMTMAIDEQLVAGAAGLRRMAHSGSDQAELRIKKLEILKTVYKILVLNFSEPPVQFIWRYEDKDDIVSDGNVYTPKQFYHEVVGINLRDYVSLLNYPGRDFYKLYQFDNCRNIFDTQDPVYANLPIAEIKTLVKKSILSNEPVWFGCDIGKAADRDKGILSIKIFDYDPIYQTGIMLDKETRIAYRYTTANHAMVLLGVDIQQGKIVKWLVENSHGKESGHEGMLTMYDDWFDEYVYEAIISVKYLPPAIKNIFKETPVHLPIWDPMSEILNLTDVQGHF